MGIFLLEIKSISYSVTTVLLLCSLNSLFPKGTMASLFMQTFFHFFVLIFLEGNMSQSFTLSIFFILLAGVIFCCLCQAVLHGQKSYSDYLNLLFFGCFWWRCRWFLLIWGELLQISCVGGFGSNSYMNKINETANINAIRAAAEKGTETLILFSVDDASSSSHLDCLHSER